MLIACGSGYVPEKYKDYKNRVYSRHLKKVNDMIMQIRQNSLKQEDKQKLIEQIIETFKNNKV